MVQKEHKAGREKHGKKGKKTLKALKDKNISVELNSKKKMRRAKNIAKEKGYLELARMV